MPSVISPEFAGNLSADAREQLDAELRVEAAKQGFDVDVASPDTGRAKSPAQQSFDTLISTGADPFGEHLSQDDVQYMLKMGIPLDKIERAARGSGMTMPAAPLDAATRELHNEAGVAQPNATPSDYNFDIGRLSIELDAGRQAVVHSTLAQWATDLHLDPTLAKGIGEYITDEGPRLTKLSDGERARWLDQQNSAIHKACGGNKALAVDKFAAAHKVLSMSDCSYNSHYTSSLQGDF